MPSAARRTAHATTRRRLTRRLTRRLDATAHATTHATTRDGSRDDSTTLTRRLTRRHLVRATLNVESQSPLRWQATHQITHVRPRKARREQLLHLPRTPPPAQLEQLPRVLRGQVLPQQTQRRSVQRATRHQAEHLRMTATHPRRRDMSTRRRLTQPERLHAILEQRRKPEIEKDLPFIQLRQVRQELSRDLISPADDARKPRQKFVVRQ